MLRAESVAGKLFYNTDICSTNVLQITHNTQAIKQQVMAF